MKHINTKCGITDRDDGAAQLLQVKVQHAGLLF
jgi:hypothetical protein